MRQTTFEVTSPSSILALSLSPIDHSGPERMKGRKKECNQRTETQINSIYSELKYLMEHKWQMRGMHPN
jgi:hypothetical protein